MTRIQSLIAALTMFSAMPAALAAQEGALDPNMGDTGALRGALQMRYDAALGLTGDAATISADDPRFMWASEAKVQCAIALGYLKSGTRDATSIGKCNDAYNRMMRQRTIPPRPVDPPKQVCGDPQPGTIFFDFDSDVPKSDAVQTIQFVAGNAQACGWNRFVVIGHTDRAGSDGYNQALSIRRAEATANLMESLGIPRASVTTGAEGESNPRVQTEDGVRNPQNRRVEISVSR